MMRFCGWLSYHLIIDIMQLFPWGGGWGEVNGSGVLELVGGFRARQIPVVIAGAELFMNKCQFWAPKFTSDWNGNVILMKVSSWNFHNFRWMTKIR